MHERTRTSELYVSPQHWQWNRPKGRREGAREQARPRLHRATTRSTEDSRGLSHQAGWRQTHQPRGRKVAKAREDKRRSSREIAGNAERPVTEDRNVGASRAKEKVEARAAVKARPVPVQTVPRARAATRARTRARAKERIRIQKTGSALPRAGRELLRLHLETSVATSGEEVGPTRVDPQALPGARPDTALVAGEALHAL